MVDSHAQLVNKGSTLWVKHARMITIGGKMVRHAQYVTFQLAEVAVRVGCTERAWIGFDSSRPSRRGPRRYDEAHR